MNLVQRVQNILLKPRETWPEIEAEPASVSSIYTQYLIILAAIPAVAGFVGMSLVGVGAFGVSYRVPLLSGLLNMVVGYVLSLVMVFLLSLLVDALAPKFGGAKNPLNAFKVVAFSATAGFLGGIFSILPAVSVLGLLAALYTIFLLYTGLPALMKCPPERAVGYTAVVIVCGFVAAIVIGGVSSLITPGGLGAIGAKGAGVRAPGNVTIKVPGSEVTIDTAKMEELSKKMEQAKASGDPAAAGKAASDMVGAVMGGGKAFSPEELKAFLPEKLDSFKRESVDAQGGAAMGIAATTVRARYEGEGKSMELSINDYGGGAALMGMAAWANVTRDKETSEEVEKIYKKGARNYSETWRKDGSNARVLVLLENGVIVEVQGDGVGIAPVRASLDALGLDRIAQLKRQPK